MRAAFESVGSIYGSFMSGISSRPVGGLLFVEARGLRWEPRVWLGRGEAHSWSLDRASVTDIQVRKMRFPSLRSYDARLLTVAGDASFIIVDPEGLLSSFSRMQRNVTDGTQSGGAA